VSVFDLRTGRVLTTICAFAASAAFVYGVRRTLIIILFAVFFAYLLEPLVLRIQRSRIGCHSRSLAIAETYLACAVVITVLLVIFGPRLAEDSRRLVQSLPSLLDRVTSGKIVWQLGSRHGWSYETQERIEQLIAGHREALISFTSQIGASVAQALANVVWMVLIPILAIFFLRDGRKISEALIGNVGDGHQQRFLRDIAQDLDAMLASFIGAQLILSGISMVVYTSVLSLLHFPYGLALGVAAGVVEFVPVVGPAVAAGSILGVGFLAAYPHLLILALFLALWRVVQDYVISPHVMGGKVELSPLASIVAVLMGGELGGVLGVYLSIPIAATVRILWVRWQRYSSTVRAATENEVAALDSPRAAQAGVAESPDRPIQIAR
jgi:predicted PurR-regulated permease PerM